MFVEDDPKSLLSLKPDELPLVLGDEPEDRDSELFLDDFFFRAAAVPSVRVPVRVCDVIFSAVASPSGGARVPASPATDSLRSALMVADRTFAAYSAAMRSAAPDGPSARSLARRAP